MVVFSMREPPITSLSICVYWSYFRWKDWKLIYGNNASRVEQEHRGAWRKPEENMQLPTIVGDDCRRMINGKTVARCLFNLKGMSHQLIIQRIPLTPTLMYKNSPSFILVE